MIHCTSKHSQPSLFITAGALGAVHSLLSHEKEMEHVMLDITMSHVAAVLWPGCLIANRSQRTVRRDGLPGGGGLQGYFDDTKTV